MNNANLTEQIQALVSMELVMGAMRASAPYLTAEERTGAEEMIEEGTADILELRKDVLSRSERLTNLLALAPSLLDAFADCALDRTEGSVFHSLVLLMDELGVLDGQPEDYTDPGPKRVIVPT